MRLIPRPGSDREGSRGQVIVLTALMMIVLVGIMGLAIDVSAAFFEQRVERSVADAASLAGAQDLQQQGSRNPPTSAEQANARSHAMDVLVALFNATSKPATSVGSPCLTAAGCALPGTPYTVGIQTPSPSCVDCAAAPELAVQVTIKRPFGLTFARVLGQSQWTVSGSSVAAILHPRRYGMVTLRPPKPRTSNPAVDTNEKNLTLNGGSTVNVINGDIGTNTTAYAPNNAYINLSPGFKLFHYDAYELWTPPPTGVQISTLIKDPNYAIPQRVTGTGGTPSYPTPADGLDTAANCAVQQALVPPAYKIRDGTPVNTLPATKVLCYKPGIYQPGTNNALTNADHDTAVLLEPGVYFLDGGLSNSSTIIGGYQGGQPGVALVFLECNNQCQMTANSSDLLALNFGDATPFGTGSRATSAVGPQGLVQTSGSEPTLMTLIVVRDPGCVVQQPYPSGCNDGVSGGSNQNLTLKLPGGGALFVAGVQYAPSDNVKVAGNATGTGTVGEIISWTLEYDSGFLNQESAASNDIGVLRLDRACSPSEICNP
jgi:Flp pilus assembly protein TadG